MGTNTENSFRIFGTTIRMYLNICFGRLCPCWFGRWFPVYGLQTYLDTGNVTVHDPLEVRKVRSAVSINYLELGSFNMLNWFLITVTGEHAAFANLNSEPSVFLVRQDVNMKLSTVL